MLSLLSGSQNLRIFPKCAHWEKNVGDVKSYILGKWNYMGVVFRLPIASPRHKQMKTPLLTLGASSCQSFEDGEYNNHQFIQCHLLQIIAYYEQTTAIYVILCMII